MKNNIITAFLCTITIFMASCKEDIKVTVDSKEAPVLSSFTPTEGKIGTEITIEGENLTDVSSVTIGGGEAALKYKIDNKKIVVKVTQESLSGKIKVKNEVGESESAGEFTITYVAPELTKIPDLFSLGQEILLEGKNLEVVNKITFGTENVEGKITYQTENEIMVIVPTFNGTDSNVRLIYFDGTSEQAVTPENAPSVDRPKPEFDSFNITEKNEGEAIEFTGRNLNLVEKITIGSHEYTKEDFITSSGTKITITLPEVNGNEIGLSINAIDYENDQIEISNNFTIKDVLLLVYKDRKIGPNEAPSGYVAFNASTGQQYTIADIIGNPETVASDMYFTSAWSSQSNIKRLGFFAPIDSYNKIKSYTSDGTTIESVIEKGTFEGLCKDILFYVLDKDTETENAIITSVKNGNLTSIPVISSELDKNIINKSAFYKNNDEIISGKSFVKDDVIIFKEVVDESTIKYGFLHIKELNAEEYYDNKDSGGTLGKAGEITFDCYFQK